MYMWWQMSKFCKAQSLSDESITDMRFSDKTKNAYIYMMHTIDYCNQRYIYVMDLQF